MVGIWTRIHIAWSKCINSLAVVENLRGKSKGEFVLSFSESVHPIVPQKKIPMNWAWGIFFTAL